MRFSTTLTAALSAAPLIAALPSIPRVRSSNSVITRDPGAVWARGLVPQQVARGAAAQASAAPEAGAGKGKAKQEGDAGEAGAGAEAGVGKGKAKQEGAAENGAGVGAGRGNNNNNDDDDDNDSDNEDDNEGRGRGNEAGRGNGTEADAGAGAGAGEAAKGEENEIAGVFGTLIDLKGDDLKQDVLFKAAVGNFEVEFQAKTARKLAVIENKTPGAAPAGFKLLDPSSYIVTLQGGGGALTLGQLDYIFDSANAALKGIDVTKTTIGKFSNAKGAFEVGDKVGETEFEVEENEIVLKVKNLDGEFALFVPDGAAAANPPAAAEPPKAGAGANNGTEAGAGKEKAKEKGKGAGEAAAQPPKVGAGRGNGTEADAGAGAGKEADQEAGKEAGAGKEKEKGKGAAEGAAGEAGEVAIKGQFGTGNAVVGGNVKQDILFPANAAGEFEVEFNGAAANRFTVNPTASTGQPPAGFAFVDPLAFVVKADAATAAADLQKIDYFFSDAIAARIDVAQGRIGKLDAATNTYVVENIGEFEFEAEEKEWTLTVKDLNGEWAILVPQAAVKA